MGIGKVYREENGPNENLCAICINENKPAEIV